MDNTPQHVREDIKNYPQAPLGPSAKRPNWPLRITVAFVVLLLSIGVMSAYLRRTSDLETRLPVTAGPGTPIANASLKIEPKVGALAPNFELKDLSTGQTVKLSSLRGRPVWVNFWATWCPPCREEMPDMEKIYGEYKDKNLAILGVDVQEDAGKVNQFTSSLELTWNFMLDSSGDTANRYEVIGMPSHFFIDKDGIIRAIHVGGFNTTGDTVKVDPRSYLAKIVGP